MALTKRITFNIILFCIFCQIVDIHYDNFDQVKTALQAISINNASCGARAVNIQMSVASSQFYWMKLLLF